MASDHCASASALAHSPRQYVYFWLSYELSPIKRRTNHRRLGS
jgi:hypothetical protein